MSPVGATSLKRLTRPSQRARQFQLPQFQPHLEDDCPCHRGWRADSAWIESARSIHVGESVWDYPESCTNYQRLHALGAISCVLLCLTLPENGGFSWLQPQTFQRIDSRAWICWSPWVQSNEISLIRCTTRPCFPDQWRVTNSTSLPRTYPVWNHPLPEFLLSDLSALELQSTAFLVMAPCDALSV